MYTSSGDSTLDVVFTAHEVLRRELRGTAVVVIDVLRATTTIVTMFESGVRRVIPVAEVSEAFDRREGCPGALLCGERHGFPVEGFDYGNSPAEFEGIDLGSKTVVLTTTNGTLAVTNCAGAERIVAGALINAEAAADTVYGWLSEPASKCTRCLLVCAGTEGRYSLDDAYAAGLIARRLEKQGCRLSDAAWSVALIAERPVADVVNVSRCRHVGVLQEKGLSGDVDSALRCNRSTTVPLFDPEAGAFVIHRRRGSC